MSRIAYLCTLHVYIKITCSHQSNILFSVTATDADIDKENKEVTYQIVNGNSDGNFYIDPKQGEIWLVKEADYENVENYTLTVSRITSFDLTLCTKQRQ